MKTYWNLSNYGNDIEMTKEQAECASHQGDCYQDVRGLLPELQNQLSKLDKEELKRELKEYGAWDNEELTDHEENLIRWVWISAGDILDNLVK